MAPDALQFSPRHDDEPIPFHVCVDLVDATVTVAGELDRENAHHVVDGLAALTGTRHRRWAIDAADVIFCDAAGLRILVTAHHLARRHGCALVLERPSPCLHRLILLVGLDRMLELHPTGAAAPPAAGGHRPLPSAGPLRAGHPIRTVPTRV
ncbi:STAS domain-containing protein [Blastococcus sp. SYSU DS0973]